MKISVNVRHELPLCFPIEVRRQDSLNKPAIVSDKSPLPARIQIVAHVARPKSAPAHKDAMAMNLMSRDEMTLNAQRLEAILNLMVKKKKPAMRRIANPSRNFAC